MKSSIKLALFAVALGTVNLASAVMRPLTPRAAAAHAQNPALVQCHAAVNRQIDEFRANSAKAATKYQAIGTVVLKNLQLREEHIARQEGALAGNETVAQCQATEQELKKLNAELANDIALGDCHVAAHKDVDAFRADLEKAKKANAVVPIVLKQLTEREKLILKQANELGTKETLASCQAVQNDLHANDALLKQEIALGECHIQINKDMDTLRFTLSEAQKTPTDSPAVRKALTDRATEKLAQEKELGTYATVGACRTANANLKSTNAKLIDDMRLAGCHSDLTGIVKRSQTNLTKARQMHASNADAMKLLAQHETEIAKHQKDVGTLTTLAQCSTEVKAIDAIDILVVKEVAIGTCQSEIKTVRDQLKTHTEASLKTGKLSSVVATRLANNENAIMRKANYSTVALCRETKTELTRLDEEIFNSYLRAR